MSSLLLVDQDAAFLEEMSRHFRRHAFKIQTADNGEALLRATSLSPPEVAVLDMSIPMADLLPAISQMRGGFSHAGIIMTSPKPKAEDIVRLLRAGAQDFIAKPVDLDTLCTKIRELVEIHTPSTHALARRLDQYVRKNSQSCELQLSTVSEHFKISRSYASKLFRQEIGQPFRDRLRGLRLERTKTYLESTDLPLYLIAYNCGFKNQARMSEVFKRTEGISPRMYRRARIGHCGQLSTHSRIYYLCQRDDSMEVTDVSRVRL